MWLIGVNGFMGGFRVVFITSRTSLIPRLIFGNLYLYILLT